MSEIEKVGNLCFDLGIKNCLKNTQIKKFCYQFGQNFSVQDEMFKINKPM